MKSDRSRLGAIQTAAPFAELENLVETLALQREKLAIKPQDAHVIRDEAPNPRQSTHSELSEGMEKTQFDTLMLAITGLDTKLTNFRGEFVSFREEVGKRFDQVDEKVETVAHQLSKTVSDVEHLKRRLEGPTA